VGIPRDLQRRLPAGGAIESTYDPLGRLHDRRTLGPEREILPLLGQPASVAPARSNVTAFKAFRYNPDGELIESIDRDRGRTKFTYDPVGQLLSMVPEKARAELFRYDKTGNLFEEGPDAETRVYSKGNRLLQKGNTQYAWDQDGRLVEKRTVEPQPGLDAPKEEVWKYQWNAAGLLQRASRSDGIIVECTYDPFARRLEKKVLQQASKLTPPKLQSRVRFVWDGDVLVHEIREAGLEKGDPVVEERTYWFEDDGFEPLAHKEKRVDDVGRERGGWFHYLNDPIGTPDKLLAEDGSVATEYERKAWGQLEARSGARATTPLRLQGQYWDEETGLAYNRYRYYHEARFIAVDPLGLSAGTNLFRFAPNPFNYADPSGLTSVGGLPWAKIYHDTQADKVFGPGSGKTTTDPSIPTRHYDKSAGGKDVEFTSNNFARKQSKESTKRACKQIKTDKAYKDLGKADPHWHFLNDPSVSKDGRKLTRALDKAGIPWTWGKQDPFTP
jgi:RHS repeat-associated protein